jgi:8-oxo-dGTP pyrophosphatase MutT (NUDIX family)
MAIIRQKVRSAKVVVVERRSFKVLVGMKSWTKGLNVPGGRVNRGEPPYIAGMRELYEESGIMLQKGALFVGRRPWVGAQGQYWDVYVAFVDEPVPIPGPIPYYAHEVAVEWGVKGHKWMSFAEIMQSRPLWNPYEWQVFEMLRDYARGTGDAALTTAMLRTKSAWKKPLKWGAGSS